jgi:DNA-binding response OmpR family regulator
LTQSQGIVLIIEDDEKIIELISHQIRDLGFEVEAALDGETGLQKALKNDYALVVLDLMLPGLGGLEICRKLRQKKEVLPILMLTACSGDVETVLGLELGADEYMTKPFRVMEFRARVRALLRRVEAIERKQGSYASQGQIAVLDLEIDLDRRTVSIKGEPVPLTATQYHLLAQLASQPGRVFSREELINSARGYDCDIYEHNVNSHISRLRGKIEPDPVHPTYVRTVRGMGYRFVELSEVSEE